MKKGQAVKFWKALSNSTSAKEVISAFANKRGYSGKRTLVRYSQVAAGFKEGLPCNVSAGKTGWSTDYIDKIHAWWKEAFPSEVGPVTQELATRVAPARTEHEVPKEARSEREPYGETPHKQEESLIVHDLSPGATDVEFLVINMSNKLLVVHRVCVEVMHWEQYDARLTTGARIIDFKYKVKVNPNFIGEILVRTPKFKYAKGDVDSFSISFISPPGNKYITRINFYCSDPETGKRFAVSTDKFEIRFHKHRIVSGEGTSSIHGAIAQTQKLLDEAKRKNDFLRGLWITEMVNNCFPYYLRNNLA